MEQSNLKLQVGDTLQLQPRDADDTRRLIVQVIGYLPGYSLLVTTPRVRDKVMIIREGQPYIVRVLVGSRVVGFTTTVLRSCARPYPYLHLSYPEEIEQIKVRNAQRVRARLFASLENANPDFGLEKPVSVTIVDISTGGGLLVSDHRLGDVGDKLVITVAIKVNDAEKLLKIPAVLRNVQADHPEDNPGSNSFSHGVQFKIEKEQDSLALHGYVYEQIVKAQSE